MSGFHLLFYKHLRVPQPTVKNITLVVENPDFSCRDPQERIKIKAILHYLAIREPGLLKPRRRNREGGKRRKEEGGRRGNWEK